MNYGLPPYGSSPFADLYFGTPIPPPIPPPLYHSHFPQTPPPYRHFSGDQHNFQSTHSPRYTSMGEYATATGPKVSPRRQSFAKKPAYHSPKRDRRSSTHFHHWPSPGESDDDEVINLPDGTTWFIPASSKAKRQPAFCCAAGGGLETDYCYCAQGAGFAEEGAAYLEEPVRRPSARKPHARRASAAGPARPRHSTAQHSSFDQTTPRPAHPARATEADAKRHRIPSGFSLKNWDPDEEPILLLGSVFDSNSLGKWIYDWTVYRHGAGKPISDMAGELWLLLIQLSGKIRRSEDCIPSVRLAEHREVLEGFLESGDRLTDKFRSLLGRCEAPMLKSGKRKNGTQLGKSAGVEFVETMFGRERELEQTERFMQSIRLWNLRFDANCEAILKRPTQ